MNLTAQYGCQVAAVFFCPTLPPNGLVHVGSNRQILCVFNSLSVASLFVSFLCIKNVFNSVEFKDSRMFNPIYCFIYCNGLLISLLFLPLLIFSESWSSSRTATWTYWSWSGGPETAPVTCTALCRRGSAATPWTSTALLAFSASWLLVWCCPALLPWWRAGGLGGRALEFLPKR